MKLERVDPFFLHSMIITNEDQERYEGPIRTLFVDRVISAFKKLQEEGLIGAWGGTVVGVPDAILETIESDPPRQAMIDLLDSAAGLHRLEGLKKPREIAGAAHRRSMEVMRIRAIQVGALTSEFDRYMADYTEARAFRDLSKELDESPVALAHSYALSMDGVTTVVLGVKNRSDIQECVEPEAKGPLASVVMSLIDGTVVRG